MTIALASAFHPRGEIPRLQKFLPQLRDAYTRICISVPPDTRADDVNALRDLNVAVVVTRDWSHGRHASLELALTNRVLSGTERSGVESKDVSHIHYTDLDRLLRWIETRPDEWRAIVERAQTCACLIIGRTARAYATHPRALVETEAISNLVGSYLLANCHCEEAIFADEAIPSQHSEPAVLGIASRKPLAMTLSARITVSPRPFDLSAGSKSFSCRAAEFLIAHSPPGRALGMDAEWTLLLHRAGFAIEYVEVEGLDWESADQFAENAADADAQRRAAEQYDADPKHWARRVAVALEIVESGLSAMRRNLPGLENQ
ncbi:MAG: hypothetical protein HZC40_02940 [Chloroflexi bacterium]|nr:hypothetical protein [Chloroflexota bacterium]